MKRLIKNVHILTMNDKMEVFPNGYVVMEDHLISEVGAMHRVFDDEAFDQVVDGQGGLLMPGMVNVHTHVGMIPFRSLGDDCEDRLRRLLLPLEKACMTKELAYASAKYAMAEMLLSGVTTFLDMYYFEDEIAKACEEMKMRGILGETVMEEPTCDAPKSHGGLVYAETFIQKWRGHKLITPAIAPHAPNTNSKEALQKARELADRYQVPLTMHVSEMDYEMAYFRETYKMTPIEAMDAWEVWANKTIAAHCIHLTEKDQQILKKRGIGIAHCIGANTKSAKGVAPIRDMLAMGLDVGLGTDGPSSGNTLDLFTQMKLFANCHKNHHRSRSLFTAKEIVALATIGGARVLGMDQEIGSIEPGKKGDVVIVETDSINMFPIFDPYAVLVYSANASNVRYVFVDGKLLVANKTLTESTIKEIRKQLNEKMQKFRKEAGQRMPAFENEGEK
jgi:cytosine/adenosine deaminase-related metal-dependent hydrolase